ncbi:unnamed protein product [Symbiodinium necroappetens]|uniref:Uncharacterized protein n=1 Tax=Symbiodinium necroappetens TaxID=1628268 RepID=A0A812KNW4_9DINO|nr:unnamed protein product [Symbiodinium necroappetens]
MHAAHIRSVCFRLLAVTRLAEWLRAAPRGPSNRLVLTCQVWSHCPDKAYLPPLKGWKIPFQGPPRNTFLMMPRTDKVKRENSERAGRAKVLEQEATHVINAAQKAAEEAKATSERDHGSLDPTLLKETEAALKPHLQALLDQLKVLETSGLGESMDAESQPLLVQHEKLSEQRANNLAYTGIFDCPAPHGIQSEDEKLLKEMLASIMEKFHEAEDLVEKAEITSAMIEHAGDDLAEAQKAAEQTEESAKQAAAAVPRQMQRSLDVITDVSLSLCERETTCICAPRCFNKKQGRPR